jgi:hypothetical protein
MGVLIVGRNNRRQPLHFIPLARHEKIVMLLDPVIVD